MPSVSKKQHNLMAMVANDPAAAKRVGIPQSVGEEFMKADKGKKFKGAQTRPQLQKVNKPKTSHGESALFSKGGDMKESKAMAKKEIAFMEKKGAPKSMIKHEKAEYGMKKGGMAECRTVAKAEVKAHEKRMHKMAGGGKVAQLSKADGVATKGKSKGTMVKMCGGGYMKKGK